MSLKDELVNMTRGPRELMLQALTNAGFSQPEAEALLGQWTTQIRPELLNLLKVISEATKTAVTRGEALTSETLCTEFRRATRSITRRRTMQERYEREGNGGPGPIRRARRRQQAPEPVPPPPPPLPLGQPIPVMINPRQPEDNNE